jgi:hypothetical protein
MVNSKWYGRKRSWPKLRYYPGIWLERLRQTTELLSQDSLSPVRDLNAGLSEYEAELCGGCSTVVSNVGRFVPASTLKPSSNAFRGMCQMIVAELARLNTAVWLSDLFQGRRKVDLSEAQNLLGCTAVFLIECQPTFQRYVLPPSSERWLIALQYIPEDSELHTRRRENFKSHMDLSGSW